MFLKHLDLTTALRPELWDGESLLYVQGNVGLYEGKFKIEGYQKGDVYLTSHRICYVDNDEPRKNSVAVDLKEIERTEFYAGFLKSSAKITIFPKPSKRASQTIKSPQPRYASPSDGLISTASGSIRPLAQSPTPARSLNATWVCPICGLSNPVPGNFDPATANQYTTLPPCQACGIKPPLALMIKSSIAAMSNRSAGATSAPPSNRNSLPPDAFASNGYGSSTLNGSTSTKLCPRCTFENSAFLSNCEICGAPLQSTTETYSGLPPSLPDRSESPGPSLSGSIVGDDTIETIKLSFRAGGEKIFHDRLRGALVQRKWLLQSAPPVPKPAPSGTPTNVSPWQTPDLSAPSTPRVVGIAGLERRGEELRQNNQAVIGTAFEDLEALMTSAKEVIAMAEKFAKQNDSGVNGDSAETRNMISESASALGLVTTKDMLGTGTGSETLYLTELARNLAEFLTDDRRGILRREGGIMSLVDLWAVFNRTRNGIELISPLDFEKAAVLWESLHLPIRLRRFKSGLLVVQEKSRTDEKTIASLLSWLRDTPDQEDAVQEQYFGRGVTAQETAERFGWSVGVATEELEMAEDSGALCRDQCLDGHRYWENFFLSTFAQATEPPLDALTSMQRLAI
jgi:ESCRT-II complex subunit VPS36